jgi:hypothetical protein
MLISTKSTQRVSPSRPGFASRFPAESGVIDPPDPLGAVGVADAAGSAVAAEVAPD